MVYCSKRIPEVFAHVKYIMLVSSNKRDGDHGWKFEDSAFWTPLFAMFSHDLSKTFGQLAHITFPNIKYVVALATPSTKEERNAPEASIYVSDQNLIEKLDFEALRKMIFDSIDGLCPAKYIQRSFACVQEGLGFRADRLNLPTFGTTLAGIKLALSHAETKHLVDLMGPEDRAMTGFEPFREIASISVDRVTLNVHLISVTEPEGMCRIFRERVIDIFAMTRRLIAEDGKPSTTPTLQFTLDVDLDTPRTRPLPAFVPTYINYFELATAWIDDLAHHSSHADQNETFDEPFELTVQMLEECTMAEFQVGALAFHDRLSAYHAQSAVGRTDADRMRNSSDY